MSGTAGHPVVTWPLSTTDDEGLASAASEARGAQDESGGSGSSENGSESAQLYPELQLLR
ncbi:hypothetical protein TYRP_003466 [Tyrophagus putrescentiae]|nr:hypothetical protein TYRP_003466 [Tyrophagus putrescentiae]